jgi:hypothetical protein
MKKNVLVEIRHKNRIASVKIVCKGIILLSKIAVHAGCHTSPSFNEKPKKGPTEGNAQPD